MKSLAIAALACAIVALGACTTFDPPKSGPETGELNTKNQGTLSPFVWRPTECSGKNCVRVSLPTGEGGEPAVAEIIGAKEQSSISMVYNPKTGDITYSATDTKGLDAQNFPLQADTALAQSLGDLWTNLAPEIKAGVLCSLGLALGFPTACN